MDEGTFPKQRQARHGVMGTNGDVNLYFSYKLRFENGSKCLFTCVDRLNVLLEDCVCITHCV